MITFLLNNLATILVSLVLLAILGLILFKLRKDKKRGVSSCSCGCEGCGASGMCHQNQTH